MTNDTTTELLKIRDARRQLLEGYRRATTESPAIQRRSCEIQEHAVAQQRTAVAAQAGLGRLYGVVVAPGAILVGAAILFLATRV